MQISENDSRSTQVRALYQFRRFRTLHVPTVIFIPAADLPAVTNNSVELGLVGQYTIDKASVLRLGYMYGHLKSTDYSYDGMQYGTITSVMPTNQTAPSYNVSVFGISYAYKWQ